MSNTSVANTVTKALSSVKLFLFLNYPESASLNHKTIFSDTFVSKEMVIREHFLVNQFSSTQRFHAVLTERKCTAISYSHLQKYWYFHTSNHNTKVFKFGVNVRVLKYTSHSNDLLPNPRTKPVSKVKKMRIL